MTLLLFLSNDCIDGTVANEINSFVQKLSLIFSFIQLKPHRVKAHESTKTQ